MTVENISTKKEVIILGFNGKMLSRKIYDTGIKKKVLAERLGISPYGLAMKISGKNEFKNSEIITICESLNLTPDERDSIFFS